MMGRVTVVGSFMFDLVARAPRRPKTGETIIGDSFGMFIGGKGANQAIAASRLNTLVCMVGRLGNDLFGNQFLDDELYIYDIVIDTILSGLLIDVIGDTLYVQTEQGEMIGINKFRKFSGSRFTMEGRYAGNKHELAISMSFNGKIQVRTQNIQCIGICEIDGSNADTTIYLNSSNAILSDLSFGYLHKTRNNFGIIIELHKKYPFNIPKNIALFNMMPPGENSIHLGSYFQIKNPKIGFWNHLNIRGGTYLKELDFTGEKFLDYGATIGLGVEFLSNTQSIDFAFLAGEKESIIFNGEYEEYISLHIGITTGEKWFMKRRRK